MRNKLGMSCVWEPHGISWNQLEQAIIDWNKLEENGISYQLKLEYCKE